VSYFDGKLAAMEADRSYSHPPTVDSNVAGFDVPLAGFGLSLSLAGFDASRAKVVRLKSHLRYTIKTGWCRSRTFFRKTNHYGLVFAEQGDAPDAVAAVAELEKDGGGG